jgi:hypothetical protein
MRSVIHMIFVLILVSVAWGYLGYVIGIDRGKNQALKLALKTNPPSEELEMTCAGLWVGQQNFKYWEKENGPRLPRNGYATSNR